MVGGGTPTTMMSNLEPLLEPLIASVSLARTLANGTEGEDLTETQITSNVLRIANASDKLLMSDFLTAVALESGITELPNRDVTCSGASCTFTFSDDDVETTEANLSFIDIYPLLGEPNLERFDSESLVVMEDNGATIIHGGAAGRLTDPAGVGEDIIFRFVGYGGWLDGSICGIEGYRTENSTSVVRHLFSYSFGNDSGTNPTGTGSATWNGVMIGATSNPDHVIQGDAQVEILDISLSSNFVDVTFSNIRNLHTRATIDTFGWANLSIMNGGFSTSSQDGSIEGTFYGMTHDEVGGIFERNDIVGAFGAAK